MKRVTSKLTLERIAAYLPEGELFDRVPMDEPYLCESFFKDAVARGAELYHLLDENKTPLALTCFLWDEARQEVELLATQSLVKDFAFTEEALPLAEEIARSMGAKSMRLCTLRTGLIKIATGKSGYRIAEVTLRKNLV